jgi:asparagine synthase (glutamine-hydrolysing)
MAFSIEARTPYMDYRLVSYALRLPDECLLSDGWSKHVLRKAMEGIVPDKIRWRKDKIHFSTPQTQWLRSSLQPLVESVFNSSELRNRGWLDQKEICHVYKRFNDESDPVSSNLIWRCLDTEVWAQTFLGTRIYRCHHFLFNIESRGSKCTKS